MSEDLAAAVREAIENVTGIDTVIGIDVEAIERWRTIFQERWSLLLLPAELTHTSGDPARMAGTWALKEAAIKALRHRRLSPRDVEVTHRPDGAPLVMIDGVAADVSVSVTYTAEHAVAAACYSSR